jgi:hypothetical protein
MKLAEAIDIAVEAMRARQNRIETMDRSPRTGDRAHELYTERQARIEHAIETLRRFGAASMHGAVSQ